MFRMKPEPVPMIGAIVVFILGLLFWLEGHRDPGNLPAHSRANLIFAVSIVISGLLFIVATGRMWFKHLWHDRYGKQRKRRR